MFDAVFFLVALACIAVVVVLATGMGGFAKGSGWAKENANRLMRLRLMFQFGAVLLIVILIIAQGGS